ncbi:MAG: methyltransferase domain-containing protein [Spirochaetes bacterium]|nr:methyltransferase domain-containing protein [Spirochaetota bacterium]
MINFIKNIRRKYIKNAKPLPKYYKIAEIVDNKSKVLDFGCGQGELSKIIIEKKGSKIIGCDLINKPKFKHKNFKYEKITKENNFPFKEKFDYIIFADVLEHLKNPKEILKEAFKHTNKCIISIPNLNFFLYRLFPKLEEPPIELTPHLHHWTLKTFTKILPQGTKIKKIKYCSDFPELRWTHKLFPKNNFFNQTLIMEIDKK